MKTETYLQQKAIKSHNKMMKQISLSIDEYIKELKPIEKRLLEYKQISELPGGKN